MRESLSAILDDEANELELERVLSMVDDDEGLRAQWSRFSQASSALSDQGLAFSSMDISRQVQAAIREPASQTQREPSDSRDRWARPFTSFAVAASVAATVVIGGQQLSQVSATDPVERPHVVSASPSPVGLVNSLGAASVQASYGTQPLPVLTPATHKAYEALAKQRMHRYMQEHAEHAALNSPQGLIPFSRVPEIRQ